MEKVCKNCGEKKEHHAKGLCYSCYKDQWKPKIIKCPRCGRKRPHHGKGLCDSCYNYVYNLENVKAYNYKKWYGIDPELYKKVRKECVICGFDKVVDIHHLDEDKENNSEENLIGLCPNHHKMLHDFRYKEKILNRLEEKGFEIPDNVNKNFTYEHD